MARVHTRGAVKSPNFGRMGNAGSLPAHVKGGTPPINRYPHNLAQISSDLWVFR
jgi:hypothetical protein